MSLAPLLPFERSRAREIEELSWNAWPALRSRLVDGWIVRWSAGYTSRANSVLPLYPGDRPVAERLRICEEFYDDQGQETIVKVVPCAEPPDLDAFLAERGYRQRSETSVHGRSLSAGEFAPDPEVLLAEGLDDRWIDAVASMNRMDPARRDVAARMLRAIAPPHVFASIEVEGAVVAAGLGVCEREWVGAFDMIVSPDHRRRGYGGRVLTSLLGWGIARGARRAYLQVVRENAPAIALYERLGFRSLYPYWYRVRSQLA